MAAAARLPLVTPEPRHLEAAHLRLFHLLHRRGWPGQLQEALADPLRRRLIHGRAVAIARQELAEAQLAAAKLRPVRPVHQHRPTFDARRAAAGDTD